MVPGAGDRLPGFETPRDRGERHAGVRAIQAERGGGLEPWSLQVLEVSDGRITGISFFLDTERLFPQFGLPPRLDG